jgi:hypothetical protein
VFGHFLSELNHSAAESVCFSIGSFHEVFAFMAQGIIRSFPSSIGYALRQDLACGQRVKAQARISLDKPVAKLSGASADSDLGHREAQDDLPVQPLDIKQIDVGQDTIFAGTREGDRREREYYWRNRDKMLEYGRIEDPKLKALQIS